MKNGHNMGSEHPNKKNRENRSNKTVALILVGTTTAHFEEHMFAFSLAPLLVLVGRDIPMTLSQLGILGATPLVMMIFFQSFYGLVVDRYGSRPIIILGTFIASLATWLTSRATAFLPLIATQVLLGIGISSYHPAGLSLVSHSFPLERRGKAFSTQGLGALVGQTLTPVLTVSLSQKYGSWRSALTIIALIGLVATLIELISLISVSGMDEPNTREIISKIESEPERKSQKQSSTLFNVSFFMFLAFTLTRASIFRNVSYFAPVFLVSIGYSVYVAGLLLSATTGVGAIGQILGGIITDRTARQSLILFVSSALSCPLILLIAFGGKNSWMGLTLVLFGFAYFSAFPAWFVFPSKVTPKNARATAYGLSQSVVSASGAIGSIIFGYIGDRFDLRASMVFLATLGALSAIIALKMRDTSDETN